MRALFGLFSAWRRSIHLDRKLVSVKFSGFALALPTLSLGFCASQSAAPCGELEDSGSNLEVFLLLLLSFTAGTHDCCIYGDLKFELESRFFFSIKTWRDPRDTDNGLRQQYYSNRKSQ